MAVFPIYICHFCQISLTAFYPSPFQLFRFFTSPQTINKHWVSITVGPIGLAVKLNNPEVLPLKTRAFKNESPV